MSPRQAVLGTEFSQLTHMAENQVVLPCPGHTYTCIPSTDLASTRPGIICFKRFKRWQNIHLCPHQYMPASWRLCVPPMIWVGHDLPVNDSCVLPSCVFLTRHLRAFKLCPNFLLSICFPVLSICSQFTSVLAEICNHEAVRWCQCKEPSGASAPLGLPAPFPWHCQCCLPALLQGSSNA